MVAGPIRMISIVFCLLVALPLAALADEPIKAVATVFPLGDIVRRVGGTHVVVTTMLPPGVYPSEFAARESTPTVLKNAELIIRIGEGGDPWSDRLVSSAKTNVRVLNTARKEDLAIAARFAGFPNEVATSTPSIPQLYIWLDPRIVRDRILPAVEQALIGLRPGHAADFRRNARLFSYEISKMDYETGANLAQMPKKQFIAQSRAWNFFFNRYGLTPAAIVQAGEAPVITTEKLVKLIEAGRSAEAHLIFRDRRPPPHSLLQLAGKLNASFVPLGVMGNEPSDKVNGYLELMRSNMKKLLLVLE